jgi:hypothetical protein
MIQPVFPPTHHPLFVRIVLWYGGWHGPYAFAYRPFKYHAKKSLGPFFPALPLLMRAPHLSLRFRIRSHATHSRHQHGLGSSFQREYFLCAGLRFVSFQQFGFSSLPPLSLCRLWRQRSNRWQFAIPLFLILRFAWGFTPCVDSVFYATDSDQAVHYASFTMLASPPTRIPRSFRLLILLRG